MQNFKMAYAGHGFVGLVVDDRHGEPVVVADCIHNGQMRLIVRNELNLWRDDVYIKVTDGCEDSGRLLVQVHLPEGYDAYFSWVGKVCSLFHNLRYSLALVSKSEETCGLCFSLVLDVDYSKEV